jgi:hypothetical protein
MLTHSALQTIVNSLTPLGNFTTVEAEPEFAKKVRLASVLLKGNSPISYTDIRRATEAAYHKIGLRIGTAKYSNTRENFQWTEEDIIAMVTPAGAAASTSSITRLGAFSGGIEWAAANLAASFLIRNIPLSSTLKFVEVAEELQKSATEDIDRIIQLINSSVGNARSTDDTDTNTKGQAYLYIAHSLDLNTIPEVLFNTPDKDSTPPTYILPVDLDAPTLTPPVEVETVDTLTVPINTVGICYFYMTGQTFTADQDLINSRAYGSLEGDPQNSKSVSYKIEKAFKVLDHNQIVNIDEVITLIADEINSETLSVTGNNVANILTAPDRGPYRTTLESAAKRELYPLTTSLKNRKATFSLYHRINKLSFDVRRYSNKSDTEILTLAFYTVPLTAWNAYEGNANADPRLLRSSGSIGIEGLIFGSQNSYSSLNNNVPYSALLNVDKGNLAVVSIASDGPGQGGGLNPTDNLANSDASNIIDTLYFAYDDPSITTLTVQPFASNLILRVTSTSYIQAIPLDIEVDLISQPFTNPYSSINANPSIELSIGEQIANRVVDAIYQFTKQTNATVSKDNSNILGVLLGDYQRITTVVNSTLGTAKEIPLEVYIDPQSSVDVQTNFSSIQENSSTYRDSLAGRVQIVAFRYRDEEYKVVLEVLSIPNNLWIATGNYILRRTQWALGRRRTISIETKVLNSSTVDVETKSEELNSVKASVSKVEASKSKLLQSVYDKRSLLEDAKKGFVNKWNHRI